MHICDTYNCDYLPHTTFCFYSINFQLNIDFPSQFCIFFTVKSPSVTQRSVSKENAFEKSKNLLPFFLKTIGSNNSFTLIENNFRFLRSNLLFLTMSKGINTIIAFMYLVFKTFIVQEKANKMLQIPIPTDCVIYIWDMKTIRILSTNHNTI